MSNINIKNILKSDNRTYTDINNIIINYYPEDNLYGLYRDLVEDDYKSYFRVINSFMYKLVDSYIIHDDNEENIKKAIIKFEYEVELAITNLDKKCQTKMMI